MPIRNVSHRFCGVKSLHSECEMFLIAFHIGSYTPIKRLSIRLLSPGVAYIQVQLTILKHIIVFTHYMHYHYWIHTSFLPDLGWSLDS